MEKEVFYDWEDVWEALDESKKEEIRKDTADVYEEAVRIQTENSRYYFGPDTSEGIDDYIIEVVKNYIDDFCETEEENGHLICTACGSKLPDYDENGEALCTIKNFLWVCDI